MVATRSEAAADAMARPFNALWDQVSTSAPTVSLQSISAILCSLKSLKSIEHVNLLEGSESFINVVKAWRG